jgi:hypothetical protein
MSYSEVNMYLMLRIISFHNSEVEINMTLLFTRVL